jgi:hypothetical protein
VSDQEIGDDFLNVHLLRHCRRYHQPHRSAGSRLHAKERAGRLIGCVLCSRAVIAPAWSDPVILGFVLSARCLAIHAKWFQMGEYRL